MTSTALEFIARQYVEDAMESVDVIDPADGELYGYALVEKRNGTHDRKLGDPALVTPVRCSRSSAWADVDDVRYVPGVGYRHFAR